VKKTLATPRDETDVKPREGDSKKKRSEQEAFTAIRSGIARKDTRREAK